MAFDQRGHGESDGHDGWAGQLDDVAFVQTLLRRRIGDPAAPLVLRGSSMGGYLAILAASDEPPARAVVAISPASGEGLRRALQA